MEKYSCIYDSVYNKTNASTSFEVKDSTKTHFSIKKEATTFCDMSPTLSQKPTKVMLCIDIKMKKIPFKEEYIELKKLRTKADTFCMNC